MLNVETRKEQMRGCGWRQPGGLYLVCAGLSRPCGKLPIELNVCPTCSGGIKPARGWTWIDVGPLVAGLPCNLDGVTTPPDPNACLGCPIMSIGHAGLLWIGAKFYSTPDEFTAEAARLGVSRRISTVPLGFEIGKTWVMVAHREAITKADDKKAPGIFHAFKPDRIEYVVDPDDSKEKLERLQNRGITLVKIERVMDEPAAETAEAAQ